LGEQTTTMTESQVDRIKKAEKAVRELVELADLKLITSGPWLVEQKQKQRLQLERNGALFGVQGVCTLTKCLTGVHIVRDA
jgi:hypothetical protein